MSIDCFALTQATRGRLVHNEHTTDLASDRCPCQGDQSLRELIRLIATLICKEFEAEIALSKEPPLIGKVANAGNYKRLKGSRP